MWRNGCDVIDCIFGINCIELIIDLGVGDWGCSFVIMVVCCDW